MGSAKLQHWLSAENITEPSITELKKVKYLKAFFSFRSTITLYAKTWKASQFQQENDNARHIILK